MLWKNDVITALIVQWIVNFSETCYVIHKKNGGYNCGPWVLWNWTLVPEELTYPHFSFRNQRKFQSAVIYIQIFLFLINFQGLTYDHIELNFFHNGSPMNAPFSGIKGTVYPVFYGKMMNSLLNVHFLYVKTVAMLSVTIYF